MTATLARGRTDKQDAVLELRKLLKPGTTVYTVLRHVSASGMSRRIDLYIMRKGEPRYITYFATAVDTSCLKILSTEIEKEQS